MSAIASANNIIIALALTSCNTYLIKIKYAYRKGGDFYKNHNLFTPLPFRRLGL